MRKVKRNHLYTVKAFKRHSQLIQSDLGKNYPIAEDAYTIAVPVTACRYWVLRKDGTIYRVLKAYKVKEQL